MSSSVLKNLKQDELAACKFQDPWGKEVKPMTVIGMMQDTFKESKKQFKTGARENWDAAYR